ncbi:MAG: hypothetical protein KatS3mg057_3055 [Herpetosiphonaceae bacterium]|nr:MAG: hypothetical protein KatS3mg057_3055 [Herpetosiphonaceae bacterium]
MLRDAIAYYHGLLDDDSARENQRILDEAQRREGLYFGERPLATVLRPRFLSSAQYAQLQEVCATVARAARQAAAYALSDKDIRQLMAFTPGEEALLEIDPGYAEPSASSRLDSFFDNENGSLQFVEYNAESPAAIAYEDVLSEVFLSLPVMVEFGRRYEIRAVPARQHMLQTLLEAFREWGRADEPRIAIVDWKGLPTHSEFVLFQRYFAGQGLDTIICAPEDLEYRNGALYACGRPINLVYKRLLTSEALERLGAAALEHPLMRAYRAGSVCLVNSFRAKPLHKKMIFALLSDPQIMDACGIDREVQALLARHVPWTRRVLPGRTTYQGHEVDLISFILEHQDRLLLKPNDDYGGKGITIGWETSAESWRRAVEAAQHDPFVVQERVHIAYEDYPAFHDGRLHIGRCLVDTDPFLFGTNVHGCLTRLSTVTLLNVTAGGGSTVPAFLIEQR